MTAGEEHPAKVEQPAIVLVHPDDKVPRRRWLEEQLRMMDAVHGVIDQWTPEDAEDRRAKKRAGQKLQKRWDNVFCILRNNTNEKYGGRPDWMGPTSTRAEHTAALDYLGICY